MNIKIKASKRKSGKSQNVDAKKFLEKLVGPLSFSKMLEATRLADELTMAEFAKKIGISPSHLNDIEKGRKVVSPERAAEFAKKLGYSESQYVRLALQDLLDRAGLEKYHVDIEKAA